MGNQTIGCTVTSCRHNVKGCDCSLDRIEVCPCCGCNSGDPEDESACRSYCKR